MPLPLPNSPWPPRQLQNILPQMAVWSAWYGGDVNQLAHVYGGSTDPTAQNFFASDAGGFKATVGRTLQRWFHGEPTRGPDRRIKLHVPIAADLCQSSADLVFADPPTLTIGKDTAPKRLAPAGPGESRQKPGRFGTAVTSTTTPTQDRLNYYTGDDLYTRLAEAAELAAALGGVYLRVSWAQDIAKEPFLTVVDADCSIPEFKFDTLTAVTFWQVIATEGQTVWRHLERHELDSEGFGIIVHALYQGERDNIGHPVPLLDQPETAGFVDVDHPEGIFSTESAGLAVAYIPNQRPHRRWRTDPLGRHLGRSDLDGVEQMMDALDETYTSWQRDIRLGKSRLIISRSLTEDNGSGQGSTINLEQEAYAPVNAMLANATAVDGLMSQVQFKIRVQEHLDTAMNLLEQIVRSAGYAGHAFGITPQTKGSKTATEVESMDRRSLLTRDRKIRLQSGPISYIVTKLLAVDQAIFNRPNIVLDDDVQVTFPDGVQESQITLAQTVMALRTAEAATTETLVGIVHPDWDPDDVAAEAAQILKEQGSAVPAPDQFGQPPADAAPAVPGSTPAAGSNPNAQGATP